MKKGIKEKGGLFAYRPHELEQAICCCLGSRDTVPIKVMLFLTGNSNDGDFRVVQKTIYDRMNISEKRYYDARKKLQEMGWIQYVEAENVIYVNYDKIYADYRNYQEKKKADSLYESPNSFSTKDSAVVKSLSERSSNEQEHCCDDSQRDCQQDRYNNIKNNKTNTINKKISSGGAGAANAAPPQFCVDLLNEFEKGIISKRDAMQKVEEWYYSELHKYAKENNLDLNSEEYRSKKKELYEIGSIYYDKFYHAS